MLVTLATLGVLTTIAVTDISAEWICIWMGILQLGGNAGRASSRPAKRGGLACTHQTRRLGEAFLVVYCIKSKAPNDISELLAFLVASYRMNFESGATFMVLSGTQDAALSASERLQVDRTNQQLPGLHVRYVRRTRSVLHKYGQYLDFIMLLNGYDPPPPSRPCRACAPACASMQPQTGQGRPPGDSCRPLFANLRWVPEEVRPRAVVGGWLSALMCRHVSSLQVALSEHSRGLQGAQLHSGGAHVAVCGHAAACTCIAKVLTHVTGHIGADPCKVACRHCAAHAR